MIPWLRRSLASTSADRSKAELFLRSQGTALEEFWDALAADTAAMSHEELRAELAPLRIWHPSDFH